MAWAVPRTWADGEIPTAAMFNADVKGNFDFVGVHAHSGAVGDGIATPGPLTYIDFTDATAPSAPSSGRTRLYTVSGKPRYRPNGGADTAFADSPHATAHQPAGADAMAVDAAAATGSLRTIGTAATAAAAGNHAHTVTDNGVARSDGEDPAGATNNAITSFAQVGTSYGTGISQSKTIGGSGKRAVSVCGTGIVANDDILNARTLDMELRRGTTQLVTRTGLSVPATTGGINTNTEPRTYTLSHLDIDVAAGSTTYDVRFQVDSGTTVDLLGRSIDIREMSIP